MGDTAKGKTISVAMATYNGERYIEEQLASLASQYYLPSELVVSDDGSTDTTLDIIERFAKIAPFPVRVLPKHERLGFSDNFLNAAEHCRGAYIAFCDQDDKWLPQKLRDQMERILADDSMLSMHSLTVVDFCLEPMAFVFRQDIERDFTYEPLDLNPYCTGWGNSMVFSSNLVRLIARSERPKQPERDLPLSHDTWVYVLAAGLGRVSHMADPLLLYRQHSTSVYGVGPMPLRIRIRAAITVPRARLIEERDFDQTMSALFSEISSSHPALKVASGAASRAYEQRVALCEARLQTYEGRNCRARLRAYHSSRKCAHYHPTAQSSLKEMIFGVFGLGAILKTIKQ